MIFGRYPKTYVLKTTVLPILQYFWPAPNFLSVVRGTQPLSRLFSRSGASPSAIFPSFHPHRRGELGRLTHRSRCRRAHAAAVTSDSMHGKKGVFLSESLLLLCPPPSPQIPIVSVVAAVELGRPRFFAVSVKLGRP
jgi:hypothetical protein